MDNNRNNYFNKDDTVDVKIEDLLLDLESKGNVNGDLTSNDNFFTDNMELKKSNDDVSTLNNMIDTSNSDFGEQDDFSDDMIDTSDDIGKEETEPPINKETQSENFSQDDLNSHKTPDDFEENNELQEDNYDDSNESKTQDENDNNSRENNKNQNEDNNSEKDNGSQKDSDKDELAENKEKSLNSDENSEKTNSTENKDDSNKVDKENKSDSKESSEANNDKKNTDNNSDQRKKTNQGNDGKGNTPTDNTEKKPDASKKNQNEKDNDKASKGMNFGNNKYVNKANNIADKASKKADIANQRANSAKKNADLMNKLNKNNTNPNKAKKMQRSADRASRKAAKTGKKALKAGKRADKARKVASAITKFSKVLTIIKIALAVIIFLVIIIFAIINVFGAVATPGQGNDINNKITGFSANDEKILEEVNSIQGITKPNAELAVYTVLFPYFESLQDGSINSYLNSDSSNLDDEEQEEYDKNSNDSETRQKILESFGCDDLCQELLGNEGVNQIIKAYAKKSLKAKFKEFFGIDSSEDELDLEDLLGDIEENSDNNNALGETDDPYLKLLSKEKYQNNLKNLLEKLSSTSKDGDYDSETDYFAYLKDTYFESDAGYKALLMQAKDEEALKNAIIEQLKIGASSYEVYIKDNCTTSYNQQSLGQVTLTDDNVMDIIKGNVSINVHVGQAGCIEGNTKCGESGVYSLDRYIEGVVYEEIGSIKDIEKIKAQMIAAKVFTLNNATISGDATNGYDLYIMWAQKKQDFCDIYDGCENAEHGDSTYGHGANRKAASTEMQEKYKQAWEETKGTYIIQSENESQSLASIHYMAECPSDWICMNQTKLEDSTYDGKDYKYILNTEYAMEQNNLAYLEVEGDYFSSYAIGSSQVCSNENTGSCGIATSAFKFYYQSDYSDVAFCGADTDESTESKNDDFVKGCSSDGGKNSICTSGCGVTSYAMLVANLSDETITPVEANEEATSASACDSTGSRSYLFTSTLINNHEGFSGSSIPYSYDGAQQVLDTIRAGGMVVANVQANSPFTDGGHWIIIRAIDETGKVLVADPNSLDRSINESYDINDFISGKWLTDEKGIAHGWYAITGPKSSQNACSVTSNNGTFNIIDKSPYGQKIEAAGISNIYSEYNSAGQCVGYVKGRGAQILSSANLSKIGISQEEANKLAKIVNSTPTPNGAASYYCESDLKNYFNISTDYTKPKAGSLVVWGGGSYGHVAIVEDVKGDKITISEGNWTNDNNLSSLKTGSGKWEIGDADLSYIKNRGSHGFNCYIYLLDPK